PRARPVRRTGDSRHPRHREVHRRPRGRRAQAEALLRADLHDLRDRLGLHRRGLEDRPARGGERQDRLPPRAGPHAPDGLSPPARAPRPARLRRRGDRPEPWGGALALAHRLGRCARSRCGLPVRVRHGAGDLPAHGRIGADGTGLRPARHPGRGLRLGPRRVGEPRTRREHRHRRLHRPHPRVRPVPARVRRAADRLSAAPVSKSERRTLLGLLGFLTFAAVYVGVVMAPVLEPIAAEFGITTGAAGLVVAGYGAPGILVPLLAGPYSDRFGRKRFLMAGSLIMGVFTLLAAVATSFAMLVAMRMIAGIGSSLIWPNVTATVGDSIPYRERGSAMATVIGLNTLAAVVGVPVAGIVAEGTSWRVSVAIVGILSTLAAVLLLWRLRPAQTRLSESRVRELYRSLLTNRSAVAAIGSSLLGSLYWL